MQTGQENIQQSNDANASNRQLVQIKASAGSGKTYTLTRRFLLNLARCDDKKNRNVACESTFQGQEQAAPAKGEEGESSGRMDWRSILAITFTNAAATEMQDRVLKVLKKIALGIYTESASEKGLSLADAFSKESARRWIENILHDKASLNISTIDSLLNLILRLSALSEKLPPDFTPAFSISEVLDPGLESLLDKAWIEQQELNEERTEAAENGEDEPMADPEKYPELNLVERACASIAEGGSKGFLVRSALAESLASVLQEMSKEEGLQISAPEDFVREEAGIELPLLRLSVWNDAKALLDGENLAVDGKRVIYPVRFSKALNNLLDAFSNAGFKMENDEKAWEKALLGIELGRAIKDADSTYFSKENLPANKGSAASEELEDLYRRFSKNLSELRCLEHMYGACKKSQPMTDLAKRVLEESKGLEENKGRVLNNEIPHMVRRILSDGHGVSEAVCRLGTRISNVMIDEFQDTNHEQWQALYPLVEEAVSTGGSLVWVGDIKQAIYGFRGGDSELFNRVRVGDDTRPPFQIQLSTNWRSAKEIVEFNNAFFAPLSKASGVLVQGNRSVTYGCPAEKILSEAVNSTCLNLPCSEIPELEEEAKKNPDKTLLEHYTEKLREAYEGATQETCPNVEEKGKGEVHFLRLSSQGQGEGRQIDDEPAEERGDDEKQCSGLLEAINLEQRRGSKLSDIIVLVRTNKNAQKAALHLSRKGIPVLTENSLVLSGHPLVIQSVAFLRFLAAPEDDISFWAFITGSLFSGATPEERVALDDELLGLLSARKKKFKNKNHTNEAKTSLFDLWKESGLKAAQKAPYIESFMQSGTVTPYDAMCEFYSHEHVFERFPDASPFLNRFLEVLSICPDSGVKSLQDFVKYWDEHGNEEKVPMPEGMNAVRIMTIHRAKGLEAPVVIVPWTSSSSRGPAPSSLLKYKTSKGKTVATIASGQSSFPAVAAKHLKEAFETVNRFYVAFTRAKSRLYVFLSAKPAGDGKILNSLIEESDMKERIEEMEIFMALQRELYPEPEAATEATEAQEQEIAQKNQEPSSTEAKEQEIAQKNQEPSPTEAQEQEIAQKSQEPSPTEAQKQGVSPRKPEPSALASEDSARKKKACEALDGGLLQLLPQSETEAEAAVEAEAEADGGELDWRPMAWFRKLNLHMEKEDGAPIGEAKEEGTFVHKCLEDLAGVPEAKRMVDAILESNLDASPSLKGNGEFKALAKEELEWFLGQPLAKLWLAKGLPEQPLQMFDFSGMRSLRVDLLVQLENATVVVDYKHGKPNKEALLQYNQQLDRYIACVKHCGMRPPFFGVIAFLTQKSFRILDDRGLCVDTDKDSLETACGWICEHGSLAGYPGASKAKGDDDNA